MDCDHCLFSTNELYLLFSMLRGSACTCYSSKIWRLLAYFQTSTALPQLKVKLDLYCGLGWLTFPFSQWHSTVVSLTESIKNSATGWLLLLLTCKRKMGPEKLKAKMKLDRLDFYHYISDKYKICCGSSKTWYH